MKVRNEWLPTRMECEESRPHHPPDVTPCLWPSESGTPADPHAPPMSCGFPTRTGWSSNVIPRMNPILIPRMHPRRQSLSA